MVDGPLAEFRKVITSADSLDLAAYLKQRFPSDENLSKFESLAGFACGHLSNLPNDLTVSVEDRHFVDNMQRDAERRAPSPEGRPIPAIRTIGPEFDFLEHIGLPSQLSAIQTLSMAIQVRRTPSRCVAIVLMARDEGIYLLEWLSHYRLTGADRIFVYTNDNADGSDQLLRELACQGYITLINNCFDAGVNPQRKAYQHAVLLLEELRDYKWALFVDADEFVTFQTDVARPLPAFIEQLERHTCGDPPGGVVFPWYWRFTDRAFKRAEVNVLGSYAHGSHHPLFKSLANVQRTLSMCEVHIPTLGEDELLVDGSMRRIEPAEVWQGIKMPYTGPAIEHFWSKSFVEFVIKKRRGDQLALEGKQFQRDYSQFFSWTGLQTRNNYRPISKVWIDKVAEGIRELLSDPAIAEGYRVAIERYYAYVAEASKDVNLRLIYGELLRTVAPIM